MALAFSQTFLPIVLAFAGEAAGAVYYVDKLRPGSDANNGLSETAPFLTIQRCFNAAINPGDACLVKNGTYAESPYMTSRRGTASQPIVVKAYPGHRPKIDCSALAPGNCVNLNSDAGPTQLLSYVTFEGFEVFGAAYTGLKYGFADHLVIRNNIIRDNGDSQGNGILGGGYAITIDRNVIRMNQYPATTNQGHGMYLLGTQYVITNNIIDSNGAYGIQTRAMPYVAGKVPDERYSNFNGLIANNTIAYQQIRPGIVLWGENGGANFDVKIVNNIFFQNSGGGPGTGVHLYSRPQTGHVIANNVFYGSTSGGQFISDPTNCSGCTIANNSTTVNPNLANAPLTRPASPDFRLTAASLAAIDKGLNLYSQGVTTDFSGAPRPNNGAAFDVGAFEHGTVAPPPPPPPPPPPAATGPVAHWKFDEGSGTTAADSSGVGSNGTLVNGPVWTTGRLGSALSFSGGSHVALGDPSSGRLDFGTGSFTYAMWVNASASAGLYDMAWTKGGSSAGFPGYDLELGSGDWHACLADGTRVVCAAIAAGRLNQWVHVAAVVDRASGLLRTYINGAAGGTASITALGSVSGAAAASIGSGSGSYPFIGKIDDVRLYNRALSASEVQGLFNAPSGSLDLNSDGATNIADVQIAVNQASGIASCSSGDVNSDGACTVVDVQLVVNKALGV